MHLQYMHCINGCMTAFLYPTDVFLKLSHCASEVTNKHSSYLRDRENHYEKTPAVSFVKKDDGS